MTDDQNEHITSAIITGAKGYLINGTTPEELIKSVRIIGVGSVVLELMVAARLLTEASVVTLNCRTTA
jgi:DNA-binding NarL/FixJ family response regulator